MKAYTVNFTPRAERLLARLYRYIAEAIGERRAEAYVGKIVASCISLSAFPIRGQQRDDVRPNLRTMGYA